MIDYSNILENPIGFRSWLTSMSPGCTIAFSRDSKSCPLARYVCCVVGPKLDVTIGKESFFIFGIYSACCSGSLEPWARRFVSKIDGLSSNSVYVTAGLALEILDYIVGIPVEIETRLTNTADLAIIA